MCDVCARLGGEGSPHRAAFLENYRPTEGGISAAAVNGNGTNHIDSLIWGYSWTGNTGQSALNITYSFDTTGADAVPVSMQAAYVSALNAWASVANVTFQALSDNDTGADIVFLRSNLQQSEGAGVIGLTSLFPSGDQILYADVDIDSSFSGANAVAKGTLGFLTLLHEIGHSLGLKHSGNYGSDSGPFLPDADDHVGATVMSYNDKTEKSATKVSQSSNAPMTPMIYDVAAIQYLYGANTSTNAGNTTHRFDLAQSTQTLWDASGTDVIDAANRSSAVTIDLREGLYNFSKIGNNFIWNAFGANIENAIGGAGADRITGNSLNNSLQGGNGNDTAYGGSGGDTLEGGLGVDSLLGEAGTDTLYGGAGGDRINGGDNSDVIYGDSLVVATTDGADSILGGDGDDTVFAGNGNDTVYGDANDDDIFGGGGADRLWGGTGADLMYGDSTSGAASDGADSLLGGDGNDTLYGGGGNDTLRGEADADRLFGDVGIDHLYGGGGNDTMTGGLGNDLFCIQASGGSDTITDFEGEGVTGGDVLRITRNINSSGIINFTTFQAATSYSGTTATINLGGGNLLIVENVATPFIASDILIA